MSKIHQGFNKDRSNTSMVVKKLVEDISTATDRREFTVVVFIEQKKAFDIIDRSFLVRASERYGVRGRGVILMINM